MPAAATVGTDTTPVVTETYLAEVFIGKNTRVTGLSLLNGSAVAGNVVLFLADANGNIVAQTASTAQSGTGAYQQIALPTSVEVLGPAKYFVGVQFNNVGARFRSLVLGNMGAGKLTGQTFGAVMPFTPPTTFTANLGPIAATY